MNIRTFNGVDYMVTVEPNGYLVIQEVGNLYANGKLTVSQIDMISIEEEINRYLHYISNTEYTNTEHIEKVNIRKDIKSLSSLCYSQRDKIKHLEDFMNKQIDVNTTQSYFNIEIKKSRCIMTFISIIVCFLIGYITGGFI